MRIKKSLLVVTLIALLGSMCLVSAVEPEQAREKLAAGHRKNVKTSFADLFRELRLTPEKAEALQALIVEKFLVARDLAIANPGKVSRTDIENGLAELDEKAKAFLTSQEYAAFKAYESSLSERHEIKQMAARLKNTNHELTDAQVEQLVAALADIKQQSRRENGGVIPIGEKAAIKDARYKQFINRITADVSVAQLDVIRGIIKEKLDLEYKKEAIASGFQK